jgi:DNA-directed RNA polymerase specialized sigma24 family protein
MLVIKGRNGIEMMPHATPIDPPPTQNSDSELWSRSMQGDDAAFEAILAKYHRQVEWRLRERKVESPEDGTQEVFIRFWRAKPDRPDQLWAFLLKVTENFAIDDARKRGRYRTVPLDAEAQHPDHLPFEVADTRPGPYRQLVGAFADIPIAEFTAEARQSHAGLSNEEVERYILFEKLELSPAEYIDYWQLTHCVRLSTGTAYNHKSLLKAKISQEDEDNHAHK